MIPSRWPNINKWAIDLARPQLPGVQVGSRSADLASPYKEVIFNAVYGARQTPISRFVQLGVEAWVTFPNGDGDAASAVALLNEVGFLIESAAPGGNVVSAVVTTGPSTARTALADPEFAEMTIELVITRL